MSTVKYTKKNNYRYTVKNPSPSVGTVKSLDSSRFVNIKYGSVVKHIPQSIFILINGWTSIRKGQEDADYDLACRRLNKSIRQYLYNTLKASEYYIDKTIVISDYPVHMMKPNKQTYVNVDITIFQKDIKPLTSDKVQFTVGRIVDSINVMFQHDKVFTYKKTKRIE